MRFGSFVEVFREPLGFRLVSGAFRGFRLVSGAFNSKSCEFSVRFGRLEVGERLRFVVREPVVLKILPFVTFSVVSHEQRAKPIASSHKGSSPLEGAFGGLTFD